MPSEAVPQRIAVIGAGMAGRAFALRCVRAGLAVALEDVMPEKLRRAQDLYASLGGEPGDGSLRFATEVEDAVRDADLAIDFVPDELESKLEIFSLLDRMAPPRTVLLTPTDVLSVTDLASCTYRPELCVGLRGDLEGTHLSVVRGGRTEEEAVQRVQSLLKVSGFTSEVIADQVETALVGRSQLLHD